MPTPTLIKKALKAHKKRAAESRERRWQKFCAGDPALMACPACRASFLGERSTPTA
jgi:hypothetical protein